MSDALVIEAVRKTITVDCVVEEAFRVFTTRRDQLVAARLALHPRRRGEGDRVRGA